MKLGTQTSLTYDVGILSIQSILEMKIIWHISFHFFFCFCLYLFWDNWIWCRNSQSIITQPLLVKDRDLHSSSWCDADVFVRTMDIYTFSDMNGQMHGQMHGQKHILDKWWTDRSTFLDMHGQKHIWYKNFLLYHCISSMRHAIPILIVAKPSLEAGECHRGKHFLISLLVQKL